MKFAVSIVPLLVFLSLESGCTYALWTNGNLVAYKEPAQNPDLHLFKSGRRQDYLVVYHEHSERTDSVHKRAYWLGQSQTRVEKQRAPVFVRQNRIHKLTAIPVFYSIPEGTNAARSLYAVCDTNKGAFTIYSGSHRIGSYDFPVYRDHWGTVEKAALTPVAVTVDIAVVGAIVAVVAVYGMAQ